MTHSPPGPTIRRVFLGVLGCVTLLALVVAVVVARRHAPAEVSAISPAAASEASPPTSEARPVPDPGPAADDEALRTRPGQVVAEGDGYVIEDVPLDQPATVEVNGQTTTATTVLRITLRAGPYPVRDAPAIVAVDGRALGILLESPDLSVMTALTFDRSVLTEGAALSFAYGLPGSARTEWTAPVRLRS